MKLYPFQKVMVDKFVDVPAVLCGDDMGLGKTYEAIALDLRRRTVKLKGQPQTSYKTLIIAPTSVVSSWEYHIKTMWPGARVAVINPKNRADLIRKLGQPYHYYVIHWEALRLIDELRNVQWWHVIADEVHRAKNRKAQQTQGLKKLQTKYKTALSGTPADNAPADLFSVLQWLYPRTWKSFWGFTNYFVKIQVHSKGVCTAMDCGGYHKQGYRKTVGVAHVDELQAAMEPYYLRRLKGDVISELPDKYYTQIQIELNPRQRRIYEQMKSDMLSWIGKHEHEPIAAPIVVAQLTRLKQFALAYAELETITVRKRDGTVQREEKVKLSEPSSKLDVLMDKIEDNPNQQFVVFSQSKQIIYLFGERLKKAGISHCLLTGDTPAAARGGMVQDFQAGRIKIFAGTIHAGGEGITLTAASTVVFLDRTWNPSRNKQAEDRLHRIGQQNAVEVIDIVAKDTVDGGHLQQLSLKWSWLKQLLGDNPEPPLPPELERVQDASVLAS